MKPIEFKGHNVVIGKGQPEYQPLPALKINDREGTVITCWELSPEEIEQVKKTGVVYLQQLTFNKALQPVYISTGLEDLAEIK